MNRLQLELNRLYLPEPQAGAENDAQSWALIDPSDRVRAMVMELARPPDWEALSKLWRGVQAELELPAPAIAVSGVDGLQLWFALAEPVTVARAHVFLGRLRQRFLADVPSSRIRMLPAADASVLRQDLHAALVPARQEPDGNWSAFLAPDLVPVFADTPWLDIPPNEEGQASLLRGMEVIKPAAFEAAFERLEPTPHAAPAAVALAAEGGAPVAPTQTDTAAANADPKRFLLQVMHDNTVALALRIEAAKALLRHADESGRRQGGGQA